MEQLQHSYLHKIDGLAWFLIRTMPRSEKNAESFLKANGVPCYLPRYNRVYINSFTGKNGKKYTYKRPPVLSPMFPGYIFAALNAEIMSLVRRHRSIAQICPHVNYSEEKLLEDLQKVQEFEFLAKNNKIEICQEIGVGTPVLIQRGPLKGWEGVVEKRLDQNFIFVRILIVGYSIGIECAAVDCESLV